uniref:Retroviral nucleocapsid Gag protein p24 C-terminal domain-containing protein n=1 Tax=Junco hyemalis TaxID=40217 RepID=A0A8C5J4R1_JUNHY
MNDLVSSRHRQGRGANSFGSASAAGGAGTNGVAPASSQSLPLVSGGPKARDTAGAVALPGGPQAFPVLRGVIHNTYEPLAYTLEKELHEAVAQHGLGSAEVMHILRRLARDTLTPHNVRCVAHSLFDPVQFGVFETKWSRLAAQAVKWNAALAPEDPRRRVVADMLMGTERYEDVQGQVGYNPLVLQQCKTLGIGAIVQTLEMAAPKQPFSTVVQGDDEPFMVFVGRLVGSVERQVPDPVAREVTIANLVKCNCNEACNKVIAAMPGDPSIWEMAEACANIIPSRWKLAAAVQPVWAAPQGGRPQQGNVQSSRKRGKKVQKVKFPMFLCGRCGRPNHMSNVCKAIVHANGQALPGSGNVKQSAKQEGRAQTQASLQTQVPMEVSFAGLQPVPADQQAWMSAPQQQLS